MKAKSKQHFIDAWMDSMFGQTLSLALQSNNPDVLNRLDALEAQGRAIVEEIAEEQGFED